MRKKYSTATLPIGSPITLYGTGSRSRSFCYVDDLVTGMIAMMDQDDVIGPVNLGADDPAARRPHPHD